MQALQSEDDLRQEAEEAKARRISELEEQLQEAKSLADNNNAAAGILNGFISKGKARVLHDGNIALVEQDDQDNYVELEPEDIIWRRAHN